MITFYNSDINDETISVLNNLIERDINPKSAFHLLKILSVIDKIIKDKNFIYNKILKKYATQGENPNEYIVDNDKVEEFREEVDELLNIKHELDIDPLDIDNLGLVDNIKVKELYPLIFLFNIDLPSYSSSSGEK